MPNWCANYASFTHEDPAQIAVVVQAFKDKNLFETFVPPPGGEWDYAWCIENWGTKWDVSGGDLISEEDTCVTMSFDTAWGPPVHFYSAMEELGFEISATYHEPGMAFAGAYEDGEDNCYEYDFENPDWADSIDNDDVLEMLEEEYNMWLEFQEELEEDEEEEDNDGEESTSA
jgi:hypothetical protein